MTTIDNNNYEQWLLRYAEGELTDDERKTVDAWLAEHPEAAEELALYAEAPRLERDESVKYAGALHHSTPLWPSVLRWSVAAAVVAALTVSVLRINTTDTPVSPAPLMAEANDIELYDTTETEVTVSPEIKQSVAPKRHKEAEPAVEYFAAVPAVNAAPTVDSIKLTPVEIIETTTLIAFENSPEEPQSIPIESLIAYDRSADWGDLLLAANDAYRESLEERPLGRMINRVLPDNRQLEENIVEPLRERIDNLKRKIK